MSVGSRQAGARAGGATRLLAGEGRPASYPAQRQRRGKKEGM